MPYIKKSKIPSDIIIKLKLELISSKINFMEYLLKTSNNRMLVIKELTAVIKLIIDLDKLLFPE